MGNSSSSRKLSRSQGTLSAPALASAAVQTEELAPAPSPSRQTADHGSPPVETLPSSSSAADYKVICLTGGPCGGKTSSLAILADLFQSLGYKVFRVPETATILLGGGVVFAECNEQQAYSFQKDLLKTMLTIQDTYINLARLNATKGQKTVVICDRGAMDPSAYMDRPGWLRMLKELNLDETDIRDNRYDCVLHLVSAAKGAESFYSLENNNTRSEGLEHARELDTRVMNAWLGHASLQVIDNAGVNNFAQKCDRAVQAVLTRLGLVADSERYGKLVRKQKFLVQNFSLSDDFPLSYRDFLVEHIYLINTSGDDRQIRIRRREEVGVNEVHMSMTVRHPEVNGQRVETRRILSRREYETLRGQADPKCSVILKKRRVFLYKDRYFQLDTFLAPSAGLTLLEAYLDFETPGIPSAGVDSLLPDFLDLKEVTDDKSYSMFTLAAQEQLDVALARKLSKLDLSEILENK
ncbi:hypothetical protein HDU85_004980 [Gaertneriomyces sp. JEL0708]|nr:hypothetical protein HDU85_004980 [Gaertneriomyces sp. JEL0708]